MDQFFLLLASTTPKTHSGELLNTGIIVNYTTRRLNIKWTPVIFTR